MNSSKAFKWIFPTVLAFVLLSFELLFSAYMLPSEKITLLVVAVLNFFFYISFTVFRIVKEKPSLKNVLILVLLSITASACFIKYVWFSGYLCLNPFNKLFAGDFHADTLSHSALTESIISNGYPSILFNTKNVFHYHFGSHYVMAGISKLLGIHAFSAYNWCYPVIFLPLFFLLLFITIESFREMSLSVREVIFIIFFCFIGYFPTFFIDNTGFWISSFFISESFCIGLVCLFSYLILLNKKNVFCLKNYVLTFLFIFICASMKISIGILIWSFCGWYILRNKGIIKIIPIGIFITVPLAIAFLIFNEKTGSASNHSIYLFQFYRRYVARYALIFHFVLVYWMFGAGIYIHFKNKSVVQEIRVQNAITEEALLFSTFISVLPGCLLYVEGGSAFYFLAIMYPIFIIYFLSQDGVELLFSKLKEKMVVFVILLLVLGGISLLNCVISARTIYKNRPSVHNSIYPIMKSKLYEQMEYLRKENHKHTGVVIEKDSELLKIYEGKDYRSLSYFIQAYTGLPVYGMYERNGGNIKLITGAVVQDDVKSLYFGLDYDEVFSEESIIDKMKSDGIKKILYLGNNQLFTNLIR